MRLKSLLCAVLISIPICFITEAVASNVINFETPGHVVTYTQNYSEDYIRELKKYYDGLKNEKAVDQLVKNQNYIEVLNYLWTEPDQNKRIKWLEKHKHHGILRFELGYEYLLRDPSLATYSLQTIPEYNVGEGLVGLDCFCTTYMCLVRVTGCLVYNYEKRAVNLLKSLDIQADDESYKQFSKKHVIKIMRKTTDLAREAFEPYLKKDSYEKLPSPTWVFSYGLQDNQMAHNKKLWPQIRARKAVELIQYIEVEYEKAKKDPKTYAEEFFDNHYDYNEGEDTES